MIKVANNVKSMLEKRALLTVGSFSPFEDQLANYAIYAGGGGLAGAGIGALVNALRGESKLKGALVGGGIGAGAGAGVKGLADAFAGNAQGLIRDYGRSGYLKRKGKEQDNKAIESYMDRTADTWSNYFKDKMFGPPIQPKGDENQKGYEKGVEMLASKSIFEAIKDDEQTGHARAALDAIHGLGDPRRLFDLRIKGRPERQ